MRQIKAKRSTVRRAENSANSAPSSGAAAPHRHLDSSISKEVHDLQQQLMATTKEYRLVKANIHKARNGQRSHEITREEVDAIPTGAEPKMYRGVGKMFMLASRADIVTHLEESVAREGKEERDLTAKAEYLERRMKSQQQNIVELTKSATSE